MSRLLSSENGVSEHYDYDPIKDEMIIQTRQDVTGLLDTMDAKRKQESWKTEVKNEMVHFCKLPTVVEVELINKGIDTSRLNDPETFRKFAREIQMNYPYLMSHQGKRFA